MGWGLMKIIFNYVTLSVAVVLRNNKLGKARKVIQYRSYWPFIVPYKGTIQTRNIDI